jgi:hypothetical protein
MWLSVPAAPVNRQTFDDYEYDRMLIHWSRERANWIGQRAAIFLEQRRADEALRFSTYAANDADHITLCRPTDLWYVLQEIAVEFDPARVGEQCMLPNNRTQLILPDTFSLTAPLPEGGLLIDKVCPRQDNERLHIGGTAPGKRKQAALCYYMVRVDGWCNYITRPISSRLLRAAAGITMT